jgi:hypothetical protein
MPLSGDTVPSARLILCHKQKTSARLRFLLFPHGVLAFEPLPLQAVISAGCSHTRVMLHPAAWAHQACERLGMPHDAISPEPEFHVEAHCNGDIVTILLATFTSIDPPFEMARTHAARFAPITDMRQLPRAELDVLGHVYEYLIG